MTTILKREEIRNSDDNATITIERYADKGCVPFWRYYCTYDHSPRAIIRGRDMLLTKPSKKRLAEQF